MLELLPVATESLTLRAFTLADAPKVLAMSRERGMREWIPDQVYADEAEAAGVLRYLIGEYSKSDAPARAPFVLGVCVGDSDELVGHVGLSPYEGVVEIGYAIEDAHQGRGLATGAARALSDWGIRVFDLPFVDGVVASDNVASCRVLERAGFDLVGEDRRSMHGLVRPVKTYRKWAP